MRRVATVECRMGSDRLPGKSLMPILGRPMLARLVERLKRCRNVDVICVATTTDAGDSGLVEVAKDEGVAAFRGPLDDVMSRLLGAARSVEADVIVQITGDCPLVDPEILDAVVNRYLQVSYDYVTNILDTLTFPVGLDVQVYSVELLAEAWQTADDPYDRENVSSYFYRNPERYRLLNLHAPPELNRPRYRLCVDYPEDFDLVSSVYTMLYPSSRAFSARQVIELLDTRPDLVSMNDWVDDAFICPSSRGLADRELLSLPG